MSELEPSLTLAIPYYSQPVFLLKTVESIAAQRSAACALLIIDDSPAGLDKRTQDEIRQLVRAKLNYRYFRTAGAQGMASTWSRCLAESATDLVTLVHGDDELTPDYAHKMLLLAARYPWASAVFCGATIINGASAKSFSFADWYKTRLIPLHDRELILQGDEALRSLLRGNYIFCPTLCYRKSALRSREFDARYRFVLDLDFVSRILLEGGTIVGVPHRPYYRYRRHSDNATVLLTREMTRFREESAFYLSLADRCDVAGYSRAGEAARTGRIIRMNLAYCTLRDFAQLRVRAGMEKLLFLRQLQRRHQPEP